MDFVYQAARALTIVLFLSYGVYYLRSDAMDAEFERFGLSRLRRVTGGLQILGALGLLAGYLVPALVMMASGGLALLMAFALGARIRVRDPLLESLPAFILLLLNLFILLYALRGSAS